MHSLTKLHFSIDNFIAIHPTLIRWPMTDLNQHWMPFSPFSMGWMSAYRPDCERYKDRTWVEFVPPDWDESSWSYIIMLHVLHGNKYHYVYEILAKMMHFSMYKIGMAHSDYIFKWTCYNVLLPSPHIPHYPRHTLSPYSHRFSGVF